MRSCWHAKGVIMICIRRGKAEACGCRRTAGDNKIKIAHAIKVCSENTENPCLADFGGTWVFSALCLNFYFCIRLALRG